MPPDGVPDPAGVVSITLIKQSVCPDSFTTSSASFFEPAGSGMSPRSVIIYTGAKVSVPTHLVQHVLAPYVGL